MLLLPYFMIISCVLLSRKEKLRSAVSIPRNRSPSVPAKRNLRSIFGGNTILSTCCDFLRSVQLVLRALWEEDSVNYRNVCPKARSCCKNDPVVPSSLLSICRRRTLFETIFNATSFYMFTKKAKLTQDRARDEVSDVCGESAVFFWIYL